MNDVEELRPSWETPPQCCATIPEMLSPPTQFYTEYRKKKAQKRGYVLDQCQKVSKWKINGKYYCAQHGGIEALRILMEKKNG